MERQLHCAEQPVWLSNLTKDCTCHEKSFAWLILLTFQTSFTMRRATRLTLQPHQIMRTATGLTLQPHEIRRLPHNPHDWCSWHVTRSYIARRQQESPSKFTKYCAGHGKWLSWLTTEWTASAHTFTHVQTCDNARVQSATQWTASVHNFNTCPSLW